MARLLKNIYHYAIACLSAVIYRFPSREIFVIGVTGTKGKSTTVELIGAMLETAGKKVALVSSVGTKIGDDEWPNTTSNTMPGRFFLQRFLRRAVAANCQYAVVEVTSQGVLQYRHRFIDFDAAVVTNLHPEHIEAHGGFPAYRAAKVRFLNDVARYSAKPHKYFFIHEALRDREYFDAAVQGFGEVKYFSGVSLLRDGLTPRYRDAFQLSDFLKFDFNLDNAAAAAAILSSQGIAWEPIAETLRAFPGVFGRMDYIQREPFAVVVDYAHTPDSLRAVYDALRKTTRGRLVCVLGAAGGGRDAWKRPVMGELAAEYCDVAIFTNEDPYDEDPLEIIRAIESGFLKRAREITSSAQREIVVDRERALERAIRIAEPSDTIIATGKGSERFIHGSHGRLIPWSERRVIESLLR